MFPTLLIGLLPPALGLLVLALPTGRAAVGLARTVAVGAALAVVLAELVPGSAVELGVVALAVSAAAWMVPALVERAGRLLARPEVGRAAGLELGFWALALHQAFDGLQVGAVAPVLGSGVALAIALHGAPLVAVTVLAVRRRRGTTPALLRGAVLLAATAVGVVAGGLVPEETVHTAAPWVAAAVAGLLLHVVSEDLPEDLPESALGRAVDVLAFVAGAGVSLLLLASGHGHGDHADHGHEALGEALAVVTLEAAPATVLGLLLGAALLAWPTPAGDGVRSGLAWTAHAPRLARVPRPRLPAALQRPAAVAFVLLAPQVVPEAWTLSLALLGPEATGLRALAVLAGTGAAVLVAGTGRAPADPALPSASGPVGALLDVTTRLAPWLVAGLFLTAWAQAFLQADDLARVTAVPGVLPLVSVLGGAAAPVDPASLTPLAALVWQRGGDAASALGLGLGASLHVASLTWLVTTCGPRRTAAIALAWTLAAGGVALLGGALLALPPPRPVPVALGAPGVLSAVSAVLLGGLVVATLLRHGARAWLATLWPHAHRS